MEKNWYHISNIDQIDTPALVVYADRVKQNIQTLLSMAEDANQLRPHVKTHKSPDVARLMLENGIRKFKCATIAEAEMLGQTGAPDVLIAYPLQGPKINRLIQLMETYPQTKYTCLVDNLISANEIAVRGKNHGVVIGVYVDLNVGMNRTGIIPGQEAIDLIKSIDDMDGIRVMGLHAYDGHIRHPDLEERRKLCDEAFCAVLEMDRAMQAEGYTLSIVAGGSPTFPIHVRRMNVESSPGTFIYWDKGYEETCAEQDFKPAALVISRVISQPAPNIFCLDLGHKSIAAENSLDRRIHFLNGPEMKFLGQSEEHLVVECSDPTALVTGQILYGEPIHICPTVALYEEVLVCVKRRITGRWPVTARDRKISI